MECRTRTDQLGPVRPVLLLREHLVEVVNYKVECKQKEEELDDKEAVIKLKERSRWTLFQVLPV